MTEAWTNEGLVCEPKQNAGSISAFCQERLLRGGHSDEWNMRRFLWVETQSMSLSRAVDEESQDS
jgi:hypothetical protein